MTVKVSCPPVPRASSVVTVSVLPGRVWHLVAQVNVQAERLLAVVQVLVYGAHAGPLNDADEVAGRQYAWKGRELR